MTLRQYRFRVSLAIALACTSVVAYLGMPFVILIGKTFAWGMVIGSGACILGAIGELVRDRRRAARIARAVGRSSYVAGNDFRNVTARFLRETDRRNVLAFRRRV